MEIARLVDSRQAEDVQEYRQAKRGGKVAWTNTHFIFAIGSSSNGRIGRVESMRGAPWAGVKAGYRICLTQLERMAEVVVSTFTFGDEANPHVQEKSPSEALQMANSLPFTGQGRNYKPALEYIIGLIDSAVHAEYLSCILFLSDGPGGTADESIEQLSALRAYGKKMLFYTIACATEEGEDMVNMVKALEGEHFAFSNPQAAQSSFTTILGL